MRIDIHTHVFPKELAPRAIPKLEEAARMRARLDGTPDGLLASMAALIVKMVVSAGSTGTAVGLRGGKLAVLCAGCVGIGFLNMMGVPCKPIAAAMLLLLGLSPVATLTLTLVLGVIIPVTGGVSIVKAGLYNRKLVLAAMTAGSLAAVLGVMLAISMDPLLLNILLLLVMLVAVISIFKK